MAVDSRPPESGSSRMPVNVILCALLAVSAIANIMVVDRYNLFSKTRQKWRSWQSPVPKVELSGVMDINQGAPSRTMPDRNATVEQVSGWQKETRARLLDLLGVEIPNAEPVVRSIRTESVGGIRRELIGIRQPDGLESPAFLLLPPSEPPYPAIIVIPGHSYGIVATAGIIGDIQHNNAMEHARAGFAVLTMEVRGFGYLRSMQTSGGRLDLNGHVMSCLFEGRTAIGVTVADMASALEYLLHREDVDASRIGVAGFSSGGLAAIFLGALDDRVKAVVASGCVSSFEKRYYIVWNDAYEAIPQFSKHLTMGDCLGLIAPRSLFVHWGAGDRGHGDRTSAYNASSLPVWEEGKRVYEILGAADQIQKHVTEGQKHEFNSPRSIQFFEEALTANPTL